MKSLTQVPVKVLFLCIAIIIGCYSIASAPTSNPSSDEDEKGFVIKRRSKSQMQVPVIVDPDKNLAIRNGRIEIPYYIKDNSGAADKQAVSSIDPKADQ